MFRNNVISKSPNQQKAHPLVAAVKNGAVAGTTRFIALHGLETVAVRRALALQVCKPQSFFRGLIPGAVSKIGKPILMTAAFSILDDYLELDSAGLTAFAAQVPVNIASNPGSVLKVAKQGSNLNYSGILKSFKPLGRFSFLYYGLDVRCAQSICWGLGTELLFRNKNGDEDSKTLALKAAGFSVPSSLATTGLELVRITAINAEKKPRFAIQVLSRTSLRGAGLLFLKMWGSTTAVGYAAAKTHSEKLK